MRLFGKWRRRARRDFADAPGLEAGRTTLAARGGQSDQNYSDDGDGGDWTFAVIALTAGLLIGAIIGALFVRDLWPSRPCDAPNEPSSSCVRDIAKLESRYSQYVQWSNQTFGNQGGGSAYSANQQSATQPPTNSWWPFSWGRSNWQNSSGANQSFNGSPNTQGYGPPNGMSQSEGYTDPDFLVWDRLIGDIANNPPAPCSEWRDIFSKKICQPPPPPVAPLSHPPMPPEVLSKLRAQAWHNDDFWAEVELGWRYYHGDDNHTEDNRDVVEAYVWDYLASVNSRVSADDTPPYVASTILNERSRITQDLSEISNVLNAEQRDDVRNRIAYVLACRGPIGYAELGNIYAPSGSGGGGAQPPTGGGAVPLITPGAGGGGSYSPGANSASLLEPNDHDALMFYKRADIVGGHGLPVYAQYTANYEQEIRGRQPNPDAIIRSAEQDAKDWRPAFNNYPRGHAKSGIALTDECGDWRIPQDLQDPSADANCDNGFPPPAGVPQTPPDAPPNYAPTSVPNGPDSNRDAAQYWAGVSRCYLKAGDSRLAVDDVNGAKQLWNSAILAGQQYGSDASIIAQRRSQMYTSDCRPSDETLKAISWSFKEQNGDLINVRAIQQALHALGFYDSRIDGRLTPETRAGITKFQRAMELDETETLTPLQTVYLMCNAAQTANDPSSQNVLGIMYATGLGVVQNTDLAVHWLQQSAEHGCADAALNLAILFGSGTIQNSYRLCDIAMSAASADEYLIEAATHGQVAAQQWINRYSKKVARTAQDRWNMIDAELQKPTVDKSGSYTHRIKVLGKRCAPEAPPPQ